MRASRGGDVTTWLGREEFLAIHRDPVGVETIVALVGDTSTASRLHDVAVVGHGRGREDEMPKCGGPLPRLGMREVCAGLRQVCATSLGLRKPVPPWKQSLPRLVFGVGTKNEERAQRAPGGAAGAAERRQRRRAAALGGAQRRRRRRTSVAPRTGHSCVRHFGTLSIFGPISVQKR